MTVYGNTEVVAALHQMVASGHVPHALLLHEDDGGGAFPLSINFLEELYSGSPRVQKLIHPDIWASSGNWRWRIRISLRMSCIRLSA